MKKKLLSVLLSATMLTAFAAGCKKSDSVKKDGKKIYFLNFKPEIEDKYKEIAEAYKKETGVEVKVVTAAGGTYETTLKSEISKSEAPTIFQINGPVGYQSWKDYTLDLKDTELYKTLLDKSMAVTDGDGVFGIPYVVEGYGIIYNDAIMKKYFELSDKAVSINSAEEINNFDTLKKVVEDMTKNKDKLGIKGVFASTSLGAGEQWRWQTHLANMPLYYEFKDKAGDGNVILAGLDSKEIEFKYDNNFKNIFDLYIDNSITDRKLLGSKTVTDSMAEFALGEVAMVQNGNWAWGQISDVDGNTVKESDIKYLPIYTGAEGEENHGLCIGTENYFAINKKVSKEKQEESIKFLEWLFGSDKGKEFVTKDLGFIAPFNTFKDDEKPADPLAKEVLRWMGKDGVESVAWTFQAFPSEDFKNYFGDALLQYAQGKNTWDDVKKEVVEKWASEKAK
ncbi:MAG: carbohydrate ABC transporter substrate-binding protein [Clostridia bacterium]|nr:carbohydrate ABC transporter substrate-binding protein [Clostridia bacterium]